MADDSICDMFESLVIKDEDRNIVPQCQEMCPREEMLFREKNGLLHRLELVDPSAENWQRYRSAVASTKGSFFNQRGNNRLQPRQHQQPQSQVQRPLPTSFTNSNRAVKSFRRSSAGQELTVADHLRTSAVLKATVDYLLDELPQKHLGMIITKGTSTSIAAQTTFSTFYDFVFDRLRAIRQDMVVQRLVDQNCLYILERCVDFYAYSHYTWQQQLSKAQSNDPKSNELSTSSSFDAHLNSVHLGECLQLVLVYYDHFHVRQFWSTRRPVFEAAYLVFNFSTTVYCGPSSEALKRYQLLQRSPFAADLFSHPLMKTAREVLLASLVGNHVRVLRLLGEVYNSQKIHQLVPIVFIVSGSLAVTHFQLLKVIATAYRSPAVTQLSLKCLASDWFCSRPENPSSVTHYLELLAKYYGFTVKSSVVDCFNVTEEQSEKPMTRSLLIQREQLPVSEWRLPKQQPQLLNPVGWLPKGRLPGVYQRFLN